MNVQATLTTSWDDGHPLDRRVAELLCKYELTGTFYVPMNNSRPVMADNEIRQLSEAFEVGAHTVNHVALTDVADETAEREIVESKMWLEDLTGRSCTAFCFPKGHFVRRHLELVRRAGFRSARTVELLSIGFPLNKGGINIIPTTIQAEPHRWTGYLKNAAKRRSSKNIANFFIHARTRHWTKIATTMLQVVARRGGVFHLWGHSWEIEEHQQWQHVESLFRAMQEFRPVAPCVPNSRVTA